MTLHRVYFGSTGPGLFDDTDLINDRSGEFTGVYRYAITSTGQGYFEQEPVLDYELGRLIDILKLRTEEFTSTGTITTNKQIVYANGTFDLFLPTLAAGDKRIYTVKNTGSGLVTLKPAVSDSGAVIEGETYQPIKSNYAISVISDGTYWWII